MQPSILFRLASLTVVFLGSMAAGWAQVEHKREWSPVRELDASAPPPPRLTERVREFEERDGPESTARLARQLFGLIKADYVPENVTQAALYRKAWESFRAGEFQEALEAYKAFSFDRFRHPAAGVKIDPADPAHRIFAEFFNTADELMRGVFRFQVFDKPIPAHVSGKGTDAVINYFRAGKHNAHMVDVVLQNGLPGRMNWTYKVPEYFSGTWHITDEQGHYAVAYRQSMCFAPLLVGYLKTGDAAFLNQWVGYMEDQMLNYSRDLTEAGIKMPTSPAGVSGVDLRHLFHLVLKAPNFDRDFPATTFARIIVQYWIEDLPLIVLGSRATGANRAMHMYGALLTDARMRFPELVESDSLLEERRRIIESYARQYMMADGTSIDYSVNYNRNYITWPPWDVQFLRAMKNPPAWFTPAWEAELTRERLIMARYLIRTLAPDGTIPGFKDPIRSQFDQTLSPGGLIARFLPEAFDDPVNAPVIKTMLDKASGAGPGYVSEAFPYGGYYIMRENWTPESRHLYFHDFRSCENSSWRHHKSIYVQAFGQRMLTAFRWESPLLVDGAGHIHHPLEDLYPETYVNKRGLFGTRTKVSAWQLPQPNRWHTSARFDLAEGSLRIPFAERFENRPPVFIDDVGHGRQVIFLREAGAWIVTDRITAEKKHEFKLLWGFEPDLLNPPGWERTTRAKTASEPAPNKNAYSKEQIVADPAAAVLRTENPQRPNLSIYHAGSLPLRIVPGEILQNNDARFGNSYRAGPGFRTDRSAVVASLIHPRRTGVADTVAFRPMKMTDGAGFDAVVPEGVAVHYRAGLQAGKLAAGKISAKASTLVVSTGPDAVRSGLVLDGTELSVDGKPVALPSADVEFSIAQDGTVSFQNIFRPMARVKILPERNVFIGRVDVTFEHPEKGVEIRYTLDGSDPTRESPLFTRPVRLDATTTVRAMAVRKGVAHLPPTTDSTLASIPATALFTKAPGLWPAVTQSGLKPGLSLKYYEHDWTLSMLQLPVLEPSVKTVAKTWMDLSAVRQNAQPYALVYEGFLKIPADGVYTFHAPWEFYDIGERAAYDLRLEVDGKTWYPASRTHNYGNWSIPLAKGLHQVRFAYVDLRRATQQANIANTFEGEKPDVRISGPKLSPQPVPASWLFHP